MEKQLQKAEESLQYTNYKPFIDENVIEYILNDLNKRVKRDFVAKLLALFTETSAYIDPINLFLKGESSVGKTHCAVETSKYFPKIDLLNAGGISPKALYHMNGKLMDGNGKEINRSDIPKKPDKKKFDNESKFEEALKKYEEEEDKFNQRLRGSYKLVDVSNQIWIFLETPGFETLKTLRPLLSHDAEEIEFYYTDKTAKGQFKTSKIVVTGYPATIFLTVDKKYIEELATRSFTATPEATDEKFKEANKATNRRAVLPDEKLEKSTEAQRIKQHILNLRTLVKINNFKVVIPFDNLSELYPHNTARDMRDFKHLMFLIKAITALNFQQRVIQSHEKRNYILSSIEDVKFALDLFDKIFESTQTGTEQKVLDFYWDIVVNDEGNMYIHQFVQAYKAKYNKILGDKRIREYLDRLCELNYVEKRNDIEDKRRNIYEPLVTDRKKGQNTLKTENVLELSLFLENGLKMWEENITPKDTFKIARKNGENGILWEKISIIDVKKEIFKNPLHTFNIWE